MGGWGGGYQNFIKPFALSKTERIEWVKEGENLCKLKKKENSLKLTHTHTLARVSCDEQTLCMIMLKNVKQCKFLFDDNIFI